MNNTLINLLKFIDKKEEISVNEILFDNLICIKAEKSN